MKAKAAPPAVTLSSEASITPEELHLAGRNHSMPLEALRYDITPLGLHYLLIHFDIPAVDPRAWRLHVGGLVEHPLVLDLDAVRALPSVDLPVTLECAGNGRARLSPRPLSQPWLSEAVGTATWTGTPLRNVLELVAPNAAAAEIVFTGLDRGIQGEVEQDYERSLPLAEAMRPEVMLCWGVNGQDLTPQHGFPLRLIVPGWYGMTHVKWLRGITLVREPFDGWQQATAYHFRPADDVEPVPVTRMEPRALMIPPGIPEFFNRVRHVPAGPVRLEGRAWSGWGAIVRVEVSTDGGGSWTEAELAEPVSPFAWRGWIFDWQAEPGDHELCCRATDSSGRVQPDRPPWNLEGVMNNAVQRLPVRVGAAAPFQAPADS